MRDLDIDPAPRRKSVPPWLQMAGWGALLYLVLWGVTFLSALKHLRESRRSLTASGIVELPKDFDGSHEPPPLDPKDERTLFYIGRLRCPCPLIVTYDFVYYGSNIGFAGRQKTLVFLGWSSEVERRPYWKFQR